jgi:hypothetical protein
MLITVLARAAGVDTAGGETWYSKAAEWAAANGVSDGANLGDKITREQIVTMLWRYEGEPAAPARVYTADADGISDWARSAVSWALETGIIEGYPDNTFKPQNNATRAEIAAILVRWPDK